VLRDPRSVPTGEGEAAATPGHCSVPGVALQTLAQLSEALGTENVANQWMLFMEEVYRLLPEILSPGRPSTKAIRASVIGQLGHRTWQAMVEAPVTKYGLGLRWSTWLQWRRAWSVIRKNPWLRDEPLTASEVIRLAAEVTKAEAPFPTDAHGLRTFWEHCRTTKARERAETLQDLRQAVHAARIEADVLRQELAAARKQVEDLAARATEAERNLTKTRASLEAIEAESRWVHLLRAMGLR
jgi:hypothetical protein